MQVDHAFAKLYKESDLIEVLQDFGLLKQYQDYCLEQRRFEQDLDQDLPTFNKTFNPFKSDGALIQDIFQDDPQLHENFVLVVKKWLEETAPKFLPCEIQKTHLKHTRDRIQKKQRGFKLGNEESIVTELDPDATNRQFRTLAPEDVNYEASLNKTIFNYIKRGQVLEAIDLCQSSNQHWKAALLRGYLDFSDPVIDRQENGLEYFDGNQNKVLWKAACFAAACDDSFDVTERAIYAALAGDYNLVANACNSWEELVWANYNALIESKLRKKLDEKALHLIQIDKIALPLPDFKLSEREVFESLKSHQNSEIQMIANEVHHLIQTHIILNNLDEFFEELKQEVSTIGIENLEEPVKRSLRFIAHLILLTRNLEIHSPSESTNSWIENYIKVLEAEGKGDLVAMYFEYLPVEKQISGYSQFLQSIKSDKQQYYELGLEANLDMLAVTEDVVQSFFSRGAVFEPISIDYSLTFPRLSDPPVKADQVQIDALGWLIFEDIQQQNLVKYSNILTKYFLLNGRINSVYVLFQEYPLNAITCDGVDDYIKEQSQFLSLLKIFELYDKWYSLYLKSKTGEHIDQLLNVTSILEGEIQLLLQTQIFGKHTDPVEDALLRQIRSIYCPSLVMYLHQIWFSTSQYQPENLRKCLELSTDVSAGLVEAFLDSDRLKGFLKAINEAAFESLKLGKKQLSWVTA
ncbi:hypothetical protein HDV04_002717 [Boothiomyces sp. JEL0838]|nr:hypothetical protein HDV04_002717 [Boothiomyces sp. JEL0838]